MRVLKCCAAGFPVQAYSWGFHPATRFDWSSHSYLFLSSNLFLPLPPFPNLFFELLRWPPFLSLVKKWLIKSDKVSPTTKLVLFTVLWRRKRTWKWCLKYLKEGCFSRRTRLGARLDLPTRATNTSAPLSRRRSVTSGSAEPWSRVEMSRAVSCKCTLLLGRSAREFLLRWVSPHLPNSLSYYLTYSTTSIPSSQPWFD